MDSTTRRLPSVTAIVVVCDFIAFTALCWFPDVAFPGKHETQARYGLFFDARVLTGVLALICSLALWRSRRLISVVGLLACLLWMIWAALPRL